jgi:hypothetical protein
VLKDLCQTGLMACRGRARATATDDDVRFYRADLDCAQETEGSAGVTNDRFLKGSFPIISATGERMSLRLQLLPRSVPDPNATGRCSLDYSRRQRLGEVEGDVLKCLRLDVQARRNRGYWNRR